MVSPSPICPALLAVTQASVITGGWVESQTPSPVSQFSYAFSQVTVGSLVGTSSWMSTCSSETCAVIGPRSRPAGSRGHRFPKCNRQPRSSSRPTAERTVVRLSSSSPQHHPSPLDKRDECRCRFGCRLPFSRAGECRGVTTTCCPHFGGSADTHVAAHTVGRAVVDDRNAPGPAIND